jgi:hypothetical protein
MDFHDIPLYSKWNMFQFMVTEVRNLTHKKSQIVTNNTQLTYSTF